MTSREPLFKGSPLGTHSNRWRLGVQLGAWNVSEHALSPPPNGNPRQSLDQSHRGPRAPGPRLLRESTAAPASGLARHREPPLHAAVLKPESGSPRKAEQSRAEQSRARREPPQGQGSRGPARSPGNPKAAQRASSNPWFALEFRKIQLIRVTVAPQLEAKPNPVTQGTGEAGGQ